MRTRRERFGSTMVRTRAIVQHLLERRGHVRLLALLANQSPAAQNDGQVWMDFFEQPTAFHCGPGLIAGRFGYLPYFAAVRRVRRGHYAVRLIPLFTEGARNEPKQVPQAYARAGESARARTTRSVFLGPQPLKA